MWDWRIERRDVRDRARHVVDALEVKLLRVKMDGS